MARKRTTSPSDLLPELRRESGRPLRHQIEGALRSGVRDGLLPPETRLPSTRALAQDLGVSRGVVVEAYEQLTAEGYLTTRAGSATRTASRPIEYRRQLAPQVTVQVVGYDFRPGVPDLGLFPRSAWAAALRRVTLNAPNSAFGYPDPKGVPTLRSQLAGYLAHARGVQADEDAVVVCTGFTQALTLACDVLLEFGIDCIGVEDPCQDDQRMLLKRRGLEVWPIPVDESGVVVEALEETPARAVLVSPAHQFPTGVVLSPERRCALIEWAEHRDGVIVEDDYDAEFRYDRKPVSALQGLAPESVLYTGSASKILAPALRIGWMIPPSRLLRNVAEAKRAADLGSPVLDQLALADMIDSGGFTRHLRRARLRYGDRRAALLAALHHHVPQAQVTGVAAGLHAVVELPRGIDEPTLILRTQRDSVRVYGMSRYRNDGEVDPPTLVLGYGALSQSAIGDGIASLGRAAETKPERQR